MTCVLALLSRARCCAATSGDVWSMRLATGLQRLVSTASAWCRCCRTAAAAASLSSIGNFVQLGHVLNCAGGLQRSTAVMVPHAGNPLIEALRKLTARPGTAARCAAQSGVRDDLAATRPVGAVRARAAGAGAAPLRRPDGAAPAAGLRRRHGVHSARLSETLPRACVGNHQGRHAECAQDERWYTCAFKVAALRPAFVRNWKVSPSRPTITRT